MVQSRFGRSSKSKNNRREMEATNLRHYCYLQDLYQSNKMSPNASLWTKIIYNVRKSTTISKYHPLTKQVFRSSKKIEDERIRHTFSQYWYIIHPFSILVLIWQEFFMTLLYLLTMYIDFYMCVPQLNTSMRIGSIEIFYIYLNLFYLLSSSMNFVTGYLKVRQVTNLNIATGTYQSKETEIILNPRKIAIRYLFTFFLIDVCPACTYPLSYLMESTSKMFEGLVYEYFFVRIFRLFRLCTVWKNLKSIIMFCNLSTNTGRVIVYVFWFWIFVFLLVLTFLAVPTIITYYNASPKTASPIIMNFETMYGREHTYNLSKITIFLLVFTYTGRALLSVCEMPHLFHTYVVEDLIHTFILFCELTVRTSGLLIAYNLIGSSSVSSLNYKTFRSEMHKFLVRAQVDPQLYSQVSTYLESTLRKEYFNEAEILTTLQTHLQYEIFNQTSTNFIRNCPLFYEVPDGIITNLALRLKFETCEEGKKILRTGEIATCMYFIASGTFAVYNKDGDEICHLYDADYFGEIALLEPYSRSFRTADVIALEYSHVFRLYVKDFDEVIKPGTELYNRISKIATTRVENKPTNN